MLSDCECINIKEKQIFIDSLDDRIVYLKKLKQKGEKKKVRAISGIEMSGIDNIIINTTKLRQDINNFKICEINR